MRSLFLVARQGLEPRLFRFRTECVADYTTRQYEAAKLKKISIDDQVFFIKNTPNSIYILSPCYE